MKVWTKLREEWATLSKRERWAIGLYLASASGMFLASLPTAVMIRGFEPVSNTEVSGVFTPAWSKLLRAGSFVALLPATILLLKACEKRGLDPLPS